MRDTRPPMWRRTVCRRGVRPIVEALALGGAIALAGSHTAAIAQQPTTPPTTTTGRPFAPPPPWATTAAPLVFTGVTVIDVQTGQRLPAQTVVIVGSRIQALGRAGTVRIPKRARVVNAKGRYLIPGLWNMHVHLFRLPNTMYRWMIANGVTTMREAGAWIPLDTFQVWKREIAAGARVGPRQLVSGRSIDECVGENSIDYHICVATPADARHLVDSFKTAGADMIKTYSLSKGMYFVIAAEARRVGIPFGGHLPDELDGLTASDSGARILDHQTYFKPNVCGDWPHIAANRAAMDAARCAAAAAHLRRNDTWVEDVVEFPAFESESAKAAYWRWQGWQKDQVLSTADRHRFSTSAAWAALFGDSVDAATGAPQGCFNTATKYHANLPLLAGTDFGNPGFGIHMYMLLNVRCGVPPLWALQTATLSPAQALHLTDSLGTVTAGKLADLVLLDGDPLTDIANVTKIRAVVANGRYYDRAALDRLQVEARAEADAEARADTAAKASTPSRP